jgi:hypothetical protein
MAAPYASADQLADALRVQVTVKNQARLAACVTAASDEIDHGHAIPEPTPALVEQTCISRAVEWWKASDSAFGVVGFEQTGVLKAPADAFARHEANLVPYLVEFGVA